MPAKSKATVRKKKIVSRTKAATKGKSPKKAASKKAGLAAGERYQCGVCGLAVTVDEECGCMDSHNLMCCGETMESA